jgi:hypothetical protein
MARYGFLVLALVIGLGGLFASYCRTQSRISSKDQSRSMWDYLLLWPLLFNRGSAVTADPKRDRVLTTRAILGWLVVLN